VAFSGLGNRFLRLLRSLRSEVPAALVLIALPKCPMCLMAILSAAGMRFIGTTFVRWLLPLLLLGTLVRLVFAARKNRNWKPFWLGMAAVSMILWGEFWSDRSLAAYIGAASIAGAWFWTNFVSGKHVGRTHCACTIAAKPMLGAIPAENKNSAGNPYSVA
jgi:hypothetical protein